jgi:mannose-6-phosphate isomerase class I
VLVTDGELNVKSDRQDLHLARGEAALLTAGEEAVVTGQGTAFVGGPGVF